MLVHKPHQRGGSSNSSSVHPTTKLATGVDNNLASSDVIRATSLLLNGGSIALKSSGVLVERSAMFAESRNHAFIAVDLILRLLFDVVHAATLSLSVSNLLLRSSEV